MSFGRPGDVLLVQVVGRLLLSCSVAPSAGVRPSVVLGCGGRVSSGVLSVARVVDVGAGARSSSFSVVGCRRACTRSGLARRCPSLPSGSDWLVCICDKDLGRLVMWPDMQIVASLSVSVIRIWATLDVAWSAGPCVVGC